MDNLTKPHSFYTDAALDLARAGSLPPTHSINLLRLLNTVRDVAAGTSLVLRMVLNADIMEASDGPRSQISHTDLFILQTLCQTGQDMIECQAEKLLNDINEAAKTQEARHG